MNPKRASILIVDDEVDTCRNLCDIFTDVGYRVDMAHEGLTALEKVRAHSYDVVLLDLMMPGMDGLTLYQEIKRLRPETVAVLATAYSNDPRAEQSLGAGVWRLVPKPVDLRQLLNIVAEAVSQPLVLVVDDDPALCLNLWDIFREQNYRVSIAHDLKGVAQRLTDNVFEVILIDMRLPDGDGSEVLRIVREMKSPARTILITGHHAELAPSMERLWAAGADAVCYKPFNLDQLFATVRRLTRPTKSSAEQ